MAAMSDVPRMRQASSAALSRRALLVGGGAMAALVGAGLVRQWRGPSQANVFIAKNQAYDGRLVNTIREGLVACGLEPKALGGKRVLLKPNMVEPVREAPHMTTNPAIVVAAADVFRSWGATVSVGEGPGHLRDTDLALQE